MALLKCIVFGLIDLAPVVGVGGGLLAAFVALRTLRHRKESFDVKLAYEILAEINRYWDRIADKEGDFDFNAGQILAQFEIASGLFNDRVLTGAAGKILEDHIVEVFTSWQSDTEGKQLLDKCRSSGRTFEELEKFIQHRFGRALLADAFRTDEKLFES